MTKILRNDPNRRMHLVTSSARVGFPEEDYAKLDPSQLPKWIDLLRVAESDARRLRRRLESMLNANSRTCSVCGALVSGRPDQVYCGATCRQRARRASQLQP